jgi:predicted RNA-binding protein YlqC (UPF0109 family)
MESMESLVYHLAQALVDDPESVSVKVKEDTEAIHVELSVAPDDMGKIIGKHGRIANAIRVITKAAGNVAHKKVYVDIVD